MPDPEEIPAATVKEVRLGLVCYGGVSLAIYMHGVTKELYKLIRAARAFDDAYDRHDYDPARYFPANRDVQGAPDYDSEPAYFAALAALADDNHPLTVVLDTIAGTSAGGINGVCLARGLAEGRSLNGFKKLWIDEGDMEDLLAGHALFPWGRGKLLSQLAVSVGRLGWHPEAALLNGDLMCNLLHDALTEMEPIEHTLIRADESLDLFVTTTDVFGYDTVIPTGCGGLAHTDKAYRQLLRFSTDFSDVPALAFAARATASFPGAFPPVSLASFLNAVGQNPETPEKLRNISDHFVYGLDYGATGDDRWFMDGGVLDNGPFDHVIDAIAAKRADGPTAREIIYLEPDPGAPPAPASGPGAEPTFARTLWNSRITIPQHTPLVGVLGELQAMNAAIAEVGAIAEAQLPQVLDALDADELRGVVGYDGVTDNAAQVRQAARQLAGQLGYATYCRLRVQAVAESFGMSLAAELRFPSESNRTNFMVAAFCSWARRQDSWKAADPDALEVQLSPVDLPLRLRRAEFVLQGVNTLFDGAQAGMRAQLVTIKSACWDLLTGLRAQQARVAREVCGQARAVFGPQALTQQDFLADPDAFAAARNEDLKGLYQACLRAVGSVMGSSQGLWETLREHTADWDEGVRARLLARYVGFPIWDALVFPVIALAKLPQLTPIIVQRFSPLDATCLAAVDADGKLKPDPSAKLDGVAIHHFGAFFQKSWRENDYLWGRLDGAELAIRLLSRQAGSDLDLTGPLRAALTAILAAEQHDLGQIRPVIQALTAQAEAMKTMKPNG